MKGKLTINDIARLTGLSKGTVDRVIHNRPEVSRKSREKVLRVIEESGYKPNLYASLLASGRKRVVAILLPDAEKGSFWELSQNGIEKAEAATEPLGISVEHVGYDQYDIDSFRIATSRILEMSPAGVVIAPLYRHETFLLTCRLKERGIPYAFVDTKPETEDYLAYYGMPLYKSGYLAGDLLTHGRDPGSVLIVRTRHEKENQPDPTVNRRAGFMDYMLERYPDCRFHQLFINPVRPDLIDSTLQAFFEEHPDVRHLVMFNSRIHLLAPFLERSGIRGFEAVGFDNLSANLDALRQGTISALIAQHPDEQVRLAIEALAEYIMLQKTPALRDNYMHMDILTRYNVEYY